MQALAYAIHKTERTMLREYTITTALVAALAAIYPAAAQAQTDQDRMRNQQVAEQCMQDLNAFAREMSEEEFWLAGWGARWGYGTGPGPAQPPAGTAAETAAEPPPPAAGPWDTAGIMASGFHSPRYQIETLYSAAHVLAQKGEEDGCQYVLSELRDTYSDYTARLQEAGVEPGAVTDWRQEQIALAEPVGQVASASRLTVDQLTGTDVRNLQDERLGSVSDVLLDPETGQVSYVIVARGGFLGIGEQSIAVPWGHFRATPGLNTLVIDAPESTFENAPSVDPETFGDPGQRTDQNRQIDEYWAQLNGG